MSQITNAALPVLDADPEAPLRAARTDALIRKNRANSPPGVADLRSKPRLSIEELNQVDLDELRERYFEDRRDARPPVIKALDLVDLPRNTIANIAFGKPTAGGMAGTVAGTALGGGAIGGLLGGPPGALAGAGIGAAIGVGAQAAAGVARLFTPGSVKDEITEGARTATLGQPSVSVSDALKQMGVSNRVALAIGGFVGDVAIDPLTYVGPAGWGAQAGRVAISGSGRKVLDRAIKQAATGGIDTVTDETAKRLILAAGYQPGQKVDDISKAVFGDISKSKVERVLRPLGAERTSTGGIFEKYANAARRADNVAEHGTIDAVRGFVEQYGKGRSGYNLRLGSAAKEGVGSEVLHVPFGGRFFPEMTVQVPAFTTDANRAVRQYQIAKSRAIAASLTAPEALESFRALNGVTERSRAVGAELVAEQERVSKRLAELAEAVEDGDQAAQTEAAKLRMEFAKKLRDWKTELAGDAEAGVTGLAEQAKRLIKDYPTFEFRGERANIETMLALGELRAEVAAQARRLEAIADNWERAYSTRASMQTALKQKVELRRKTVDDLVRMQEKVTPGGLGAYLDSDELGQPILNADPKVQARVFEQARPLIERIDELTKEVTPANQQGMGLGAEGLPGGAQPLFVAEEAMPAERVASVTAAGQELEQLRRQLWEVTEPLRREKPPPPMAPRAPLNPTLQPTPLPKIKRPKAPKEPKPTSKAAMIAAVSARYPEALTKNLPPGRKRPVEMPSEADRLMFLAEQAGDDHGRLLAHLARMDKEGDLVEWKTGGVSSVKAGTLSVGDTFAIDGATVEVVEATSDGIVLRVRFIEGEEIPMGGGEVLPAAERFEEFRLKADDDVPLNDGSLSESVEDVAQAGLQWFRGINDFNRSANDRFYSASREIAADYAGGGAVEELASMPKNPMLAQDKYELADQIGYSGDPLAEPLDAAIKFDDLAREYAKSRGHDAIEYASGTFDEPELHVFGPASPPPPPVEAAPAAPVQEPSRRMQTLEEFTTDLTQRELATYTDIQRNLWKQADDVDVEGIDKIANTPTPSEVLARAFSAEADATKALYDSLGGVLDKHRTPEFENVIRVVKMALGTDDDFIPHSMIGSMRSALGGLYQDQTPATGLMEKIDRVSRRAFGARGGLQAKTIASLKRQATADYQLARLQIAEQIAKETDGAAARAGVPLDMVDDIRRLALIYAQEAAAKAANITSPIAMKIADDKTGLLVDSAEAVAFRTIKDKLAQLPGREKLLEDLRQIGVNAAATINAIGEADVREGLLEFMVPGYFPHVATTQTRESLSAKRVLPQFQEQELGAARAGKGPVENFQRPTTTDLYQFQDPLTGLWHKFLEMDRWVLDVSEAALQEMRSADPDMAAHVERLKPIIELYERLPDPPPPQRVGVMTANQFQREGRFGALSVGDVPFFEESLPLVMGARLGMSQRAEANRQLMEVIAASAMRVPMDDLLRETTANAGQPKTLPNGMVLETIPSRVGDPVVVVRARGKSWRALSARMASFKDNPVIASIADGNLDFVLPEETADAIEDAALAWQPENASRMLRFAEEATGIMRSVTLLHPSWTISNIIGNITNAWSAGINIRKMLQYLPAVAKVRWGRNTPELLDGIAVTAGGQTLKGSDLASLLSERQVFGDHVPGYIAAEWASRGFNKLPSELRSMPVGMALKADTMAAMARMKKATGKTGKGLAALSGGGNIGWNRLNRWVFAPWVRANAFIEDAFRGAAVLASLDEGNDLESALEQVRKGLFSYHDLTQFEERWMRNIFPFYSWMRNNLAYQIHTLVQRPAYIAAVPRVRDALEEMLAGEAQVPQEARPSWMQSALAMQLGSDPDSRFAAILSNTIPQAEVLQILQGAVGADGAADVAKYFLGGVNPWLTAVFQIGAGVQFFSGRTIEPGGGGDMSLGDFLVSQVRPIAEYGPGGKVADAFGRGFGQGVSRALLGGRIQAFDEDRLRTTRLAEFREEIERHRKGIRRAEREGRPSTPERAALMRTYKAMLDAGLDEDVPRYARGQLAELEATP